jgi:hypothetical protein
VKPGDKDWVLQQLQSVKARKAVGDTVLKLLEVWDVAGDKMKEDAVDQTLTYFSKLAKRHVLADDKKTKWAQAGPGLINVGDEVRVKLDAFTGSTGVLHNGRIGKVVAIRYGDVIVNSTDEVVPSLSGAHFSPHVLEKRVLA